MIIHRTYKSYIECTVPTAATRKMSHTLDKNPDSMNKEYQKGQ